MTTPRLPHLLNRPSAHPGRAIRMIELAEWMAHNGGSISEAAKALGRSYHGTKNAWRRIRQHLGPQAI